MKSNLLLCPLVIFSVLTLSGCVVRTYSVTKDRIDQNLSAGNRGYLQGQAPSVNDTERRGSRTTHVVEIELGSSVKSAKASKPKTQEETGLAQREQGISTGYVMSSETPQTLESPAFEQYTVEKNDTLQKISKKFYGTTKRWTKIYEANKDILKGPDRVYPGQVLNIPVAQGREPLKETPENLK
jgi:nucleoid-associated protein YgaU